MKTIKISYSVINSGSVEFLEAEIPVDSIYSFSCIPRKCYKANGGFKKWIKTYSIVTEINGEKQIYNRCSKEAYDQLKVLLKDKYSKFRSVSEADKAVLRRGHVIRLAIGWEYKIKK